MARINRKDVSTTTWISVCASVVLTVTIAQGCFKDYHLGKACDITDCDASARCHPVNLYPTINDDAYTVISGNRKTKVSWESLCRKDFYVWDDQAYCTIPAYCESFVYGWRATGGLCPEPGPQ